MATRATDGARARALLSLNLKKKTDCSQSHFLQQYLYKVRVLPAQGKQVT